MTVAKQKTNSRELRQFKVVLLTSAELVYSDGKDETLLACDGWVYEGDANAVNCEVYLDLKLWRKRSELFRAGHRLVIMAHTDSVSPMLYATDAWFDRECGG
jgi:hypothetical protein